MHLKRLQIKFISKWKQIYLVKRESSLPLICFIYKNKRRRLSCRQILFTHQTLMIFLNFKYIFYIFILVYIHILLLLLNEWQFRHILNGNKTKNLNSKPLSDKKFKIMTRKKVLTISEMNSDHSFWLITSTWSQTHKK